MHPHSGRMKSVHPFMWLLVVAQLSVAQAASESEQSVTIRTYNYAPASVEHFAAAKSEAAHIFGTARISLDWIECRVRGVATGAPCTQPLVAGRDLMLRLVDRAPGREGRIVALGESMLDREGRGGVLMTVDLYPVRTIAAGGSAMLSTLLGRAIAHEIGHLLLGSAEHPRFGLMRALWSHDELRGLKPAHWGFSRREAAQMRKALRARSRTAD